MKILTYATEKRKDAWPSETPRLRVHTLLTQAEVAEKDFHQLGSVEGIIKAVDCRRQVVSLTPDGHEQKWHQLAALGEALYRKFEQLGDILDIDEAIQCLSQARQLISDWHPTQLTLLDTLGRAYRHRFERLGQLTDIDKIIEYLSQAVLLILDGHADKPAMHNSLGDSYQLRFERLGEVADIHKAVGCFRQAVWLTPDGHPDKPYWYHSLGSAYQLRFERLGKLADIDKAIECESQAVLLTPDGHANMPAMHTNLGNSYRLRFEWLGELADIDKAIECLSQAVLFTPDDHAVKPLLHNNLGISYQCRFERLGKPIDIDKIIEHVGQAVQLAPDDHEDKPAMYNNLGNSFRARFEWLGMLADIDKAIEYLRQAVLLAPLGHADKPAMYKNLGTSYQSRFQRLGKLEDIDKAIECSSQAVLLTPDNHADRPSVHDNLGVSYHLRFERLGDLEDLCKAVECLEKAVLLTPDGHADKPSRQNNLGVVYRFRGHFGELEDINKAIECLSQAVLLTPDGHPDKPSRHSNLGHTFQCRFGRLGELADIQKAVECHGQAVLLAPDSHPDKPGMHSNLGDSYQSRFEGLGDPEDLDKAIQCLKQAVLLTPDGHAKKPLLYSKLGRSYNSRFKHHQQLTDLECAQSAFKCAALFVVTRPRTQLDAGRDWAECSILLGRSPEQAYARCMELIPHLIWLGTTIHRRYTLLTQISNLATEAASWAISVQSYDLALEWLEAGRSIVWNQILDLRTPFEDLFSADPLLANQLKDIATQLESAGSRQGGPDPFTSLELDLEAAAQDHRQLAAEWELRLDEVRRIPGFDSFMKPRKAADLKLAARDGPVILINTDRARCDALIILPQCKDVTHVHLPDLVLETVKESFAQGHPSSLARHRGDQSWRFIRLQGPKPTNPLKTQLATLWSIVVKPILDVLSCMPETSAEKIPHVTWCATGPLSFAPLHAAGLHDGLSPNTFDLIISSYTPSLSALLASDLPVTQPKISLLAVGQEYTEGHSQLPCVAQELVAIENQALQTPFLRLDGEKATVEPVLNAMEEHSWVHLACHATQDPHNPAHSAFHLHNGDLTLEAITKRQFRDKGLAFLSACQTAKGDSKLPDEAIHLAAGMLMAGYPSVIATMWSIWDADGPDVAERVYADLLKDGQLNHRSSAEALHQAVGELREKIGMDKFERWVPFIHVGV